MKNTQKYPDGRLNDEDDGALDVKITTDQGRVIIDFGKPVAWLGLTCEEARVFARALMQHANKVSQ